MNSRNQIMCKCAVVGGVIIFLWNVLFWGILPWQKSTMMRFSNEEKVADVIRDNAPKSGVYVLPNFYKMKKEPIAQTECGRMVDCNKSDNSMKDYRHAKYLAERGPVMFAAIQLNGMGSFKVALILSLIIDILAAFFAAWLLLHTKLDYRAGVLFVTVIGLFAAIVSYLPSWNWWGFNCSYTLTAMISMVIGWFLAGLAMVKLAAHKHGNKR